MATDDRQGLERSLGLGLMLFYGVGTILGLGIYVLLGKVAGESGTLAPASFLLAAGLATFTGLAYGELAARIPRSAGEVNYVDEAFGLRALSVAVGWMIVLSAIVSTATVVNGYVGYVHVFVEWPEWLIISAMTLALGGIAAWGIKESAATITIITTIELVGIGLVIAVAGHHLGGLGERWPEFVPSASIADLRLVALGAFLAFFTFIGFEDMVNVAEEVRDPQRTLPRAIMLSLAILTVLYVLVALIATLALDSAQLDASDAPLATVLEGEGENYPRIISLVSLVAIVNGVLVQLVMVARVLYGMAQKGMAPGRFGRVHPTTRTPLAGTVVTTGVVLALALAFELEALARATSFILLAVFVLVDLSLVVLKRRDPHPAGVRSWPIWVPATGAGLSLALLVFQGLHSAGALG